MAGAAAKLCGIVMDGPEYTFTAELWLYSGEKASWHFITLPKEEARHIRFLMQGKRVGWGSVRVAATIGATTWKTSIFPDKKSSSYILPVKAEVRTREKLHVGKKTNVTLSLIL